MEGWKLIQVKQRAALRAAMPGKGRRADHQGSRASVIHLFCRECAGGPSGVTDCPVTDCFLWPYRGLGSTDRPAGAVPTVEEYAELADGMGNAEALKGRRSERP